ncbi:hypothetical protein RhiirA5_461513 [Rhizophagus irregularis]|uniref:Crinkler effector protein N-terminal domain-containing protein n=1 Tax=Rhizophagus irregularis TaxID=588596 RepID=A0A2N0NY95_9GLOM|nr:hypothetical protein RhiirA5_461513 [Rhizophagus irregularis]
MTENYICCFIQGANSKFLVNVEAIETIEDLRDLIVCQQRKFFRNLNIDEYGIFKISVSFDDNAKYEKLKTSPIMIEREKLEDSQKISETFKINKMQIQVFMGILVDTSMKKIVKEASVSTQIRELTETVQVSIVQNRDMIEQLLVEQNRVLLERIDAKKTKFVTKGKELNELCKTRVLRVGDVFRFEKKFETLAGIKINQDFKIVAINNNTYAPTVQIKDEKVLVDGVVMLERQIINNHVKEEIKRQIVQDKENFLKKLQDYNHKRGGGREEKIRTAINENLEIKDLITRIFEVQITNIHSESNIFFDIHNSEMKMIDYIETYFKKWK